METSAPSARTRILDAALSVIRSKGYEAATVDELCAAAGATKGAFFHHFKSKEDMGIAATAHFSAMADGLFDAAAFRSVEDPLQRLLGYIDLRIAILQGPLPQFTCLLGTMVQETYETNPRLRDACYSNISAHAYMVAEIVNAARGKYVPNAMWTSESLAFHTQAVIQGAFILAKAKGGPAIAVESLQHLRRYIELLFADGQQQSGLAREKAA